MDAFTAWTDKTSAALIQWANPNLKNPVTAGWPMTRLDHALLVLLPYLVLVIYGAINKPPSEEIKAAAAKAKAEAKAKGKQAAKGLGQQISEEPIKLPMLLYNAVQVALCGWMCYEALAQAIARGFELRPCNPFVETEVGIARVLWVFYLSKILDFLDTLFIVARGQWGQFTFLHTYHHISIYLIYWLNANAGFDGDIYFTVVANSFVHAVMYGYYLLRILGVPFPFKNLVTQLQMIQFVAMNAQAIYILYNGCPFPNNITWFYLFYILSLLVLFANFYVHSYIIGAGKKGKGKKAE